MTRGTGNEAKDWAGNARAFSLAWGTPILIILFGSYFDPPVRATLWSVALAWMGGACLINAKRCGRTHCRYSGPFYLVMIVPVLLAGTGVTIAEPYDWWILGAVILLGGKLIWWATEALWGRFTVDGR